MLKFELVLCFRNKDYLKFLNAVLTLLFLLLLANVLCFFCILDIFDLYLDLFPLGLLALGLLALDLVVLGLLVFNFVGVLSVIFLVLGGESWRVEVLALMDGVTEDPDWRGPTEARIVTYKMKGIFALRKSSLH